MIEQKYEVADFARQAIAAAPPFENMTLDVDENGIFSAVSGDKA